MFADIVPRARLPRGLDFFTYLIPKDFAAHDSSLIGKWVTIPFRGRGHDGILWALHDTTSLSLRKVLPISEVQNFLSLSKEQRAGLEFLARESFVSLPHAAYAMLPQPPRRAMKRLLNQPAAHGSRETLHLSRQRAAIIQQAVKHIHALSPDTIQFYPFGVREEWLALLLGLCTMLSATSSLIVLVPTDTELSLASSLLANRFGQRLVIISSALSLTDAWQAWCVRAARTGSIVLTTKIGVLAPVHKLHTLIIVNAADRRHRQDEQNPRYDARRLALFLAHQHKARCVALDAVPSLELVSNQGVKRSTIQARKQDRRALDMHNERLQKNFAPLGDMVIRHIQLASKPVLLFLNHKGENRRLVCQDCGWTMRCPSCAVPLTIHAKDVLRCHRCLYETHEPLVCPTCASTSLRKRGLGTQSLMRYCMDTFPNKNVVRVDHDQPAASLAAADLVIATEQLLSSIHMPAFSTMVIVDFDSLVQFPDYTANENTFVLLEHVAALLRDSATVFLQTYNPDHVVAKAFCTQQQDRVWDEEMRFRKQLLLPPAARVVKLILKKQQECAVEKQAATLLATLRATLPSSVRIEDPVVPRSPKLGRFHRRFLIIRFLFDQSSPATLDAVRTALSDDILVDVDPPSLFT